MLVVVFGPPAVGKMTVGYELAKLTGLRLFHNHMTAELVRPFFDFSHPTFGRLVSEFRIRIFEEVAASDLPGLIFTFVWALDHEDDSTFIQRATETFARHGRQTLLIELEADLAERLRRNESEFRLAEKPSKRDTVQSRENLLAIERKYRMNSTGELSGENYLKLQNTNMPADAAARRIVAAFPDLPRLDGS